MKTKLFFLMVFLSVTTMSVLCSCKKEAVSKKGTNMQSPGGTLPNGPNQQYYETTLNQD